MSPATVSLSSPRRASSVRFAGLVLALVALTSNAAELRGRVIGVADGDTVTVLDDAREQHKVRLSGIDAPERGQAFGDASKRNLSALAFNQTVTVEWHKRDRYGRLVGVVRVQPSDQDVGLAQVRAGMAWHYTAYAHEQSAEDQQLYSDAEAKARGVRSGLWRDPSPVPPWEQRTARRDAQAERRTEAATATRD